MTTTDNRRPAGGSVDPPPGKLFSLDSRLTGMTLGVRVSGILDLATVDELENLLSAYDGPARHYFFFLDTVPFVDVVGWKPIGSRCANGAGRVVSASPAVRRLMELLETSHVYRACW